MANEEHVEVLKSGVDVWNSWRRVNPTTSPDLRLSHLAGMNLSGVALGKADLSYANLNGANLDGANFFAANLHTAICSGANFNDATLNEANLININLNRANLTGANINDANLSHARIKSADLSQAVLLNTNLRNADLSDSNLSNANLTFANLSKADLSSAILRHANVSGANLDGCNLHNTDLSQSVMGNSILTDIDLREAKGLTSIKHIGPSDISIRTIYLSEGNIPEVFLRGCGVPDDFITYMRSLTTKAIEFYSCFISYSSKDQEFADRLHTDLQARGVRVWFAPHDMKIGGRIRPTIDESIRVYDKLLLVLSRHSVSSQWVEQEVETALRKERQGGDTVLFSVRLDDSVFEIGEGWPALVKDTRHVGDFTRWKEHDSYRKAFDRLLRDLKAEA